jgi:hypothetical protein
MKKLFIFSFALVISFGIIGTVNADLTGFSIGTDHFVYDSSLGITWYDYTYSATGWDDAKSWTAGLTVGRTTAGSWSLPTTPGTTFGYTDEGEMGHLYYDNLGNTADAFTNVGPFTNLQPYVYWSGTEFALYPDFAWLFRFCDGSQVVIDKYDFDFYALAVHPGDIRAASVPEPATVLLLVTGIAGLAAFRRRMGGIPGT